MFWEAYYSLCLKIKKSSNAVAKEIGCSSGAATSESFCSARRQQPYSFSEESRKIMSFRLTAVDFSQSRHAVIPSRTALRRHWASVSCRLMRYHCVGIVPDEIFAFSEKIFSRGEICPFCPFLSDTIISWISPEISFFMCRTQ